MFVSRFVRVFSRVFVITIRHLSVLAVYGCCHGILLVCDSVCRYRRLVVVLYRRCSSYIIVGVFIDFMYLLQELIPKYNTFDAHNNSFYKVYKKFFIYVISNFTFFWSYY